jgi:hypothetical protein
MAKKEHVEQPEAKNATSAEQTGGTQLPETGGEQPAGAAIGETAEEHATLSEDENTNQAELSAETQQAEMTVAETAEIKKQDKQPVEQTVQSSGTATAEDIAVQPAETNPGKTDEQLEENLFAAKAAEMFAGYPHVSAFWFTSDVTAFFSENDARNHAGTLDSKSITKISR